ncbi:hypothetical protein [Bradyrhizobium elkanii]|uniref:hypothetical protein n=1 Tax=Bradyrhizobium elkanii TaxID=29448 RepID=UPI0004B45D8D|nr:hypothetical protein [Bradyrhizobium elkanii]WLA79584.1 hypothetical protein QNJ99_29830 [Bradyrhizobium elkanii]
MRVTVGRPIRVDPGDTVAVRGQLPEKAKLGRLYVFAKEDAADAFSPYVQNIGVVTAQASPHLYTPMSMRLDSYRREYEMSFVADIDGFIRVMQEVDTAKEPRAKVRIKRTICPGLGWREWLVRKLNGIFTWQTLKFSP